MNVRTFAIAALAAGAFGVAPAVVTTEAGGLADDNVTLKGCLVKGDGDGAGYLLTNSPDVALLRQGNADRNIEPSIVGTAGDFQSVFYWLDGNNDLKKNIGHQVEIRGELKGDLKDGEIKLDRKDNWTQVTVKSDGRTMKADVPNASMYPAPHDDKDRKAHLLVRKVDVQKVTMLGATCESQDR